MDLLERAGVLRDLQDAMSAVGRTSGGRLVLVSGEPGVGKTAVVNLFCRDVARSIRVVVGRCDDMSAPRPLAPFFDIAQMGDGRLGAALDGGDRRALFDVLIDEVTGAVVVLEDLQWADDATLDLVRFLGRRLDRLAALIVVTHRDDLRRDHPLRRVLGDLVGRDVIRVCLAPLSREAVGLLAAGTTVDPDELFRRTQGNPFFVVETLAGGDLGVPATVRDAVLARSATLSDPARAVLDVAAVIGARVEPALLDAVAEPSPDTVDECVERGFLRRAGERLAFVHDLVRRAIEDSIPAGKARRLHARVLDALGAEGDLARRAHHAEGAGDGDKVVAVAPGAAEEAARLGAHREAATQYDRALRFEASLTPTDRADLLERFAYELYLTDQIEPAIGARLRALADWTRLGDELRCGDNLRWLSRLSWFVPRGDDARSYGAKAIDVLEAHPPGRELAWAYSNQAQLCMLALDVEGARHWAPRAIELGQTVGDIEVVAHALNNLGTAALIIDDETGVELLERSLALSLGAGLEEPAARAYANLGSESVMHRRYEAAVGTLEAGIAYCDERGLDTLAHYMGSWLARTRLELGQWGAAAEAATVVIADASSPLAQIGALVVLGRIRARRGDPGVWPLLDEAMSIAVAAAELQRTAPVAAGRLEAAWLAGDARPEVPFARAVLEEAERSSDRWAAGELAVLLHRSGALSLRPSVLAEPFARELEGDHRAAAETWKRIGCPFEAAMALGGSGDAASVWEALSSLEALGARAAWDRIAPRLGELGETVPRGPRRATRANPAGLTPREVEVLVLVREGLRDIEIADRLVVSRKTVGHHVSAILAKLGVRSRTEAATVAGRLGIGPET
jgi:DNA-binding CsgD family transcriptional regulator/tetratricopeptide (TPR) repeat protein